MSKVGLLHRVRVIEKAIADSNPLRYAVHKLPPQLRQQYDVWRAECDAIVSIFKGNLYEAFLNGQTYTPQMPAQVAAAIGVTHDYPVITTDMSLNDAQEMWTAMLDGPSRAGRAHG